MQVILNITKVTSHWWLVAFCSLLLTIWHVMYWNSIIEHMLLLLMVHGLLCIWHLTTPPKYAVSDWLVRQWGMSRWQLQQIRGSNWRWYHLLSLMYSTLASHSISLTLSDYANTCYFRYTKDFISCNQRVFMLSSQLSCPYRRNSIWLSVA